MSEIGELFAEHKKQRQEQHREWHEKNRAEIDASGIPYSDRPEALLFREEGRPQCDFYPSTGRWRRVGKGNRAQSGGARKFIKWYRENQI